MCLTEAQKQLIAEKQRIAVERLKQTQARLHPRTNVLAQIPLGNGLSGQFAAYQGPTSAGTAMPSNRYPSVVRSASGGPTIMGLPSRGPPENHSHGQLTTQFNNVSTGSRVVPATKSSVPIRKIPAKASLTSRSRFDVQSGYCVQLTELFKRFRTKLYDPKRRIWSFDLSDYNTLERAVTNELKDYIQWEGLPRCILNAFTKGWLSASTEDLELDLVTSLTPHLLNALLSYQVDGVKFAIKNHGRILLADDMGLGKTVQAIAAAVYYKESWPVLCVVPNSMRFEWKEQWLRWVNTLREGDVSVVRTGKHTDALVGVKVAIITYDLLVTMKNHLVNKFPTLIFDESHSLKNYKAQRTKAAVDVCKNALRVLMLSGTPALSRPSELYPQLEMINSELFRSFPEFGKRYCGGHTTNLGYVDYSGISNAEELQIVLENTVMIRRLKKDVATQLPPKHRVVVVLDPDTVRFDLHELTTSAGNFARERTSGTASAQEIRGKLLQYFQHTGRAKLPAVIQYLQEVMEGNSALKIVVFAHHCQLVMELFEALGGDHCGIRIDGSTPSETRKHLCDKFQRDDQCKFAVLSITACSTGITLTAASLVVFAELYWNPGILTQAEDRLHRLGQQNHVTVKYLVAKDTADDMIWPMLQRKLGFLNDAGLSTDSFSNLETMNHKVSLPANISWEDLVTEDINGSSDQDPAPKRMRVDCPESLVQKY